MRLICCLLLTSCGPGIFECGDASGETIWGDEVCDGVVHCWNGADERTEFCTTDVFYCAQEPEPQVILTRQVCDEIWHCEDGSDEAACR